MNALRVTLVWVVVGGIAATTPRAARAQSGSTSITPLQPLAFGTLVPGVTDVVSVTDGWRRAAIRLDGSGQNSVRFVLPTALTSTTSTATIPLTFGASSAAYVTAKSATLQYFDPTAGTKINLNSAQGSATIYLGATAVPASLQQAGIYSATVIIVVTSPNM